MFDRQGHSQTITLTCVRPQVLVQCALRARGEPRVTTLETTLALALRGAFAISIQVQALWHIVRHAAPA